MAVVVARTGLTPDALRVWERRYGVVAPARGAGGHRLYSDADVERLRLLREATAGGRRIGDVSRLSESELARLVEEDRRAAPGPVVGAGSVPGAGGAGELVAEGLERIRALDSAGLEGLLRRALALLGLRGFIDELVVPLLHGVGDEWQGGVVTIAQEHMASALVQDILVEVMRATAGRGVAGPVGVLVLATPSGERHGIGVLLAGALAATAGWEVVNLGVDLPAAEVATAAAQAEADLVALGVTSASTAEAVSELRVLSELLPARTELVAGGSALATAADELDAAGVRFAPDLAAFDAVLARVTERSVAARRRRR